MTQTLLEQQRRVATQEQIFQILFDSDEITWKQIIFNLIETEQMDPWDIDISLIAKKFLDMLKTLKRMDFRISGKIILASAILLKLKSTKLMEEDFAALDHLINSADEPVELFDQAYDGEIAVSYRHTDKPRLIVRSPQPRKRKVSVYDLVEALEKALEVDARRIHYEPRTFRAAEVPKNHIDISAVIKDVYHKVNKHYKQRNPATLTFTDLLEGQEKEDKVLTFIPLLHLDCQRKVDLQQKEHFGNILIHLLQPNAKFTQMELK